MFVIKRDFTRQPVFYDKITARNIKLAHDLNVDTTSLSQSVIKGLSSGMTTRDIDRLSCESAIHRSIYEPDYGVLAARIAWNDLHKNTPSSFREVLTLLYNNKNFRGENNPLVSENIYNFAMSHIDIIEKELDYSRDYGYSYFAFKTLEKSYLQRVDGKIVERPQHMIMRVSLGIHGPSTRNGILSVGNIEGVLSSYREMSMKKFTHASPTLFNASSNRPQNSSCFLLSMPDSMGEDEYEGDVVVKGPIEEVSIPECWKHCSKISKHAGGIGVDVTRVRCRGAIISGSGGRSDGIIPLVRVLNEIGRYVNQGGRRKGAIAVYLEPWHPDTPEFLEIRLNGGSEELKARDIFPALWIPDLFFKRLESGGEWCFFCPGSYPELIQLYGEEFEKRYIQLESEGKMVRRMKASELWEKILKSLDEKGLPYMLSKDSINRKSNQKNIGTITSSNLCVSPDTMILTDLGQYPIGELEDVKVNVWNGEEFSPTIVRKTGIDKKLIKVNFSNGENIKCTPEHEFYIMKTYSKSSAEKVQAQNLEVGMKLIKFDLPILNGDKNKNLNYPYTEGFFTGDGTYDITSKGEKVPRIDLYGEKKELLEYLDILKVGKYNENQDRISVYIPKDISPKYTVPINAEIENKLQWLAGICDSDGCVCKNGSNLSIQIGSIDKNFLLKIRLMLQTLGVESKINKSHNKCLKNMPDGKGGEKLYECQEMWRILISSSQLEKLLYLGFECYRLKLDNFKAPNREAYSFIKVESVELETGIVSDTFCFTEEKKHMGMFNGILTGQCCEIVQYHNPKSIAVCNLASISLPSFVNKEKGTFDFIELGRIVEMAIENLNLVLDKNYSPVRFCAENNLSYRPIGLGVQGLADVFAILSFPWESEEAKILNRVIFECIYYHSLKKSSQLASTSESYDGFVGSPASLGILQYDMWNTSPITSVDNKQKYSIDIPKYDWNLLKENVKRGLRNSLLVAPMPTASTSQILGNNESFEPFTSNIYARKVIAGDFPLVNPHLYKDLTDIGKWNKENVDKIIKDDGSVQSLDIPQHLKDVYKTVWEIPQKVIIDMAADRGAFIDQTQSMNIHIKRPTPSKLSSMYMYAWKKGLKTLSYYLRSQATVDPVKFNIMEISDPTQKIKEEMDKNNKKNDKKEEYICNDEVCMMCSS